MLTSQCLTAGRPALSPAVWPLTAFPDWLPVAGVCGFTWMFALQPSHWSSALWPTLLAGAKLLELMCGV